MCACLTDTSHTGCHCSLWVDWCSRWLMLARSSVVLHVCCSTACPQVTFPSVCVCVWAFLWVLEVDKDDMINILKDKTKQKKNYFTPLALPITDEWYGLSCIHLSSLVHRCYPSLSAVIFAISHTALMLPCQFILSSSSMAGVYPLPSLTPAL